MNTKPRAVSPKARIRVTLGLVAVPLLALSLAGLSGNAELTKPKTNSIVNAGPTQLQSSSKTVAEYFSLISAPKGALLDFYDDLATAANDGDSDAAFTLYHELRECQGAPQSLEEVEERSEQQNAYGMSSQSSEEQRAAESYASENLADSLLEDFNRCQGVPRDGGLASLGWLVLSAEQGNPHAQLTYELDGVTAYENNMHLVERDPTIVQNYKARALHYLNLARDAGQTESLLRLGLAYQEGHLVEKNDSLAYSYFVASDLANGRGQGEVFAKLLRRYMAQPQVSDSVLRGEEIFNACCY